MRLDSLVYLGFLLLELSTIVQIGLLLLWVLSLEPF